MTAPARPSVRPRDIVVELLAVVGAPILVLAVFAPDLRRPGFLATYAVLGALFVAAKFLPTRRARAAGFVAALAVLVAAVAGLLPTPAHADVARCSSARVGQLCSDYPGGTVIRKQAPRPGEPGFVGPVVQQQGNAYGVRYLGAVQGERVWVRFGARSVAKGAAAARTSRFAVAGAVCGPLAAYVPHTLAKAVSSSACTAAVSVYAGSIGATFRDAHEQHRCVYLELAGVRPTRWYPVRC